MSRGRFVFVILDVIPKHPYHPHCYRPKSSRFEKIFLPANHADLRESKKSFARSAVSRRLSELGVPGVLGPWDNPQAEHPRTGITVSHGPRTAFRQRPLRSKATRRGVSHSKKLRQMEPTSFLLAFIRVFRGLNFGCGGAALGNPRFLSPLQRFNDLTQRSHFFETLRIFFVCSE